ncbi:hypothetical protein [Olsenella uli]|uniref:hypothetical protein n=1 Tax=Olsenella uli TaxID=133926 RepID=UPI0028D6E74A|nr:hypothetical protein [Olsenella uli]
MLDAVIIATAVHMKAPIRSLNSKKARSAVAAISKLLNKEADAAPDRRIPAKRLPSLATFKSTITVISGMSRGASARPLGSPEIPVSQGLRMARDAYASAMLRSAPRYRRPDARKG